MLRPSWWIPDAASLAKNWEDLVFPPCLLEKAPRYSPPSVQYMTMGLPHPLQAAKASHKSLLSPHACGYTTSTQGDWPSRELLYQLLQLKPLQRVPPCCHLQAQTPTRFKPMSLPKFDPKDNVHTFIRLFEMSMYGANNQDKATTLLNQLDAASTDLIIPHMPKHNWLYTAAKNVLFYKFGSITQVTKRKNDFLMIIFRKYKTITDFANSFYLEVQILTGSGLLTVHDAHIALRAAVKPYKALNQTIMPAFQDNCTLDSMVRYLRQCGDTFRPPNTGPKPHLVSNYPGRSEAPINNKSPSKPDITKVICHHCNQKGHYASSCNSKTGIHVLPHLEPEVQGKVNVE
ncbi:hypothetical protein DSO57_1028636 [Entomophthora muscae]|uniref:Uncharacterized protein n=1 Tax=Entomophthora muscae TaxID=34485 RepID=A0ACC2UAF8_9FUNG|nr:hypothetical protein DSO57_1028636 [Entomophthora muscae]